MEVRNQLEMNRQMKMLTQIFTPRKRSQELYALLQDLSRGETRSAAYPSGMVPDDALTLGGRMAMRCWQRVPYLVFCYKIFGVIYWSATEKPAFRGLEVGAL